MGVIDSTNPSSQRVAPLEHGVHPEGHVARRIASKRVAPLEHEVHPEGHVAWMMMKENLNDPKTINADKFLNKPLIKLSPCSNQNLNLKHL
jgi:hypothetical protein